jgi:hypothetical protein
VVPVFGSHEHVTGWHCVEVIWENEFAYSSKSITGRFQRSNEPEIDGFGIRNFGIGTTHKLYNAQPDYCIVGSSSRLYLRFPDRQRPSLADRVVLTS